VGTVLHPVGPLPPRAYWLRRVLIVLVVVLVVALVWWLFAGMGSGSPAAGPTGSGTPTPTTTPTSPTSTPTPTHTTTSPTSTPTATTTSPSPTSTAGVAACPDSAIKVTALTDATSYPAGKDPRLTVEVGNIGTVSCKRDVGQVALELIVSSGSARTWSSDDCNPGGSHAVVTLRAGQTFSTTVVWSRTTSAPGCPSGKPKAAPGHYQLVARNLTLKSAPAPFQLL
jgi:cytoskeletal protein RodZ